MRDASCGGPPPLGGLLARASHLLTGAVAQALARHGLSLRGFLLLQAASRGLSSQQSLAALVGLDKTTMVAAVDELAARGLVERRPDPQDRRVRLVVLTPDGARVLEGARAVVTAVEDDLLEELGQEGRDQLRGLLVRLLEGRLGAQDAGGSCV